MSQANSHDAAFLPPPGERPIRHVAVGEAVGARRAECVPRTVVLTCRERISSVLRCAAACETSLLRGPEATSGLRVRFELLGPNVFGARSRAADLPEGWHVAGRSLTGQFSDESGVYTFDSLVLGGRGATILLARPLALQRSSRRSMPRRRLPPDNGIAVVLPAADGGAIDDGRLVDLSVAGLRLALPADVQLPLGRAVRIRLGLRPDRGVEVVAVARNLAAEESRGVLVYGLEIIRAPEWFHHAVEHALTRIVRPTGVEFAELPHMPGSSPRVEVPAAVGSTPRRRWEYRG